MILNIKKNVEIILTLARSLFTWGLIFWLLTTTVFLVIIQIFIPFWLSLILTFLFLCLCFWYNSWESTVGLVRRIIISYFQEMKPGGMPEVELIERVIQRRYRYFRKDLIDVVRKLFIERLDNTETPKERLFKLTITIFLCENGFANDNIYATNRAIAIIEREYNKIMPLHC